MIESVSYTDYKTRVRFIAYHANFVAFIGKVIYNEPIVNFHLSVFSAIIARVEKVSMSDPT